MQSRSAKVLRRAGWRGWGKKVMLTPPAIALLFLCAAPAVAADIDKVSVRLFELQLSLAEKGNSAAQYHVAEMYENGLGAEQNLDQALAWYKKSAAGGNAHARSKIAAWDQTIKRNSRAGTPPSVPAREMAPAPAAKAPAIETDKPKQTVKSRDVMKAVKSTPPQEDKRTAAIPNEASDGPTAPPPSPPQQPAVNAPLTGAVAGPTASAAAPTVASAPEPPAAKPENATPVANAANEAESFSANPCKSTSARFLSTCRQGKGTRK